MRDIESEVYACLGEIYPAYEHGSISEKETNADNYFTVELVDPSYPHSYDDVFVTEEYDFIITFYTTDPELVKTTARQAEAELTEIGLISQGPPIPVKSEVNARYGRMAEYKYIHRKE